MIYGYMIKNKSLIHENELAEATNSLDQSILNEFKKRFNKDFIINYSKSYATITLINKEDIITNKLLKSVYNTKDKSDREYIIDMYMMKNLFPKLNSIEKSIKNIDDYGIDYDIINKNINNEKYFGIEWEIHIKFKKSLNEATNNSKSKLSSDQIKHVQEYIDKTYSNDLYKLYNEVISKCPKELQDVAFYNGTFKSRYDNYYDQFIISADTFESPGFTFNEYTDNEQEDIKKIIAINNQYHKNLIYLYKELSTVLKEKYKNMFSIKFFTEGYSHNNESNISEYIKILNYWTKQNGECPSNDIELCFALSDYSKLVPSQLDIDKSKQEKYLNLYKSFVDFLQNPKKMTGNFWSATLYDICHIIGMSSEKLNSIVASNFKGGQKMNIKPSYFDNDPEWAENKLKELGDLYELDHDGDCDYLAYSPLKKHLYWINFEHTEINKFFEEEFPFNSEEFEDIVYENNKETISNLRNLFNTYKLISELLK